MNKICVLGSINMDIVVQVDVMPIEGETIFGDSLISSPGGKGANQAIAAKRTGSDVYFIGKVGKDVSGEELLNGFIKEGINVTGIYTDLNNSTGTAFITVNKVGQNSIIVVSGTNMTIERSQLENTKSIIENCEILISQFETPIDITIDSFKFAKSKGLTTILNPAPVQMIPEEFLKYTDIIVPNESEVAGITGISVEDIDSGRKAAEYFFSHGVKFVIITLGEKGAFLFDHDCRVYVPAYKVNAVDTTAAGDSFIGALGSSLNTKNLNLDSITEAVNFANKVASLTVQKHGAQNSIPYLEEINFQRL